MFIAKQLKKENIVEYLLYMWQIEDLLRACKLDIDIANEKLILTQQLSDEQRKALYDWTESLIEMMKRIDGDIMILGIAGKMGVTMGRQAVNAIRAAGVSRGLRKFCRDFRRIRSRT